MPYENKHVFRDGNIVLYTRNGRPTYHARLKIEGLAGYVVQSTRRRSLPEAARVAEDHYEDLRFKARHGLEVKAHTFESVWHQFRSNNALVLSSHRLKFFDGTAERYFLPYFQNHSIESINDHTLREYWNWRIGYWSSDRGLQKILSAQNSRTTQKKRHNSKLGNVARIPAYKTLLMEQSALRQVFRWANRAGIINRAPEIKAPKLKHAPEIVRRPAFDELEWYWLKQRIEAWALRMGEFKSDRLNSLHLYQRSMLRAYVHFMINSGLRPNEARQLRWRDISHIRDKAGDDQIVLHISPNTKTGERDVVPLKKVDLALKMIPAISKQTGPEGLVFCDHQGAPISNFGKTFKKLLSRFGLLKDRYGRTRSIYSLRHTYATFMLLRGTNIEDLAQNMGTSPGQIYKHYRHITMQQKADAMGMTQSHW